MARHSGPLVTNLASSLIQLQSASPTGARRLVGSIRTGIQQRLERAQTQRSDAIVAPTEAALAYASRLWDIEDIPSAVLPNMDDISEIRRLGDSTTAVHNSDNGPVIAYFGRLERNKGVDVLVESMLEVWERWPDAELKLIGLDKRWNGEATSSHLRVLAGQHSPTLHVLGQPQPRAPFPTLAEAD